ncbi:hypothetical protein BP00DRAFT_353152 [Aspergillus indologenus CBS 114.80]|uniref:Zn(2)-C6 fungal-type domain-containing protein n=1 Tax=Aspergillus indologenus CBS 114.80 TaxID=1450541 RepID=A0A2V5HSZ3_9EURO|nr:hypothetical protein BP00DRAFT_353152 [Aspergillus indologenus CBS 114.80]
MFHTFDLSLKHGAEGESELSPGRNDRVRKACELCRQMKVKCDGTHPCKHCSHSFHECIYRDTHRKRHADSGHRTSARPGKKPSLQKRSDHNDDFDADALQIVACQPGTPGLMHEGDRDEGRLEARHHGSSGERSFIERLKLELGDSPGIDFESRLRVKERLAPRLFLLGSPNCLSRTSVPLPERQRAQILVNQALDAHLLYNALHRPTFTSVFQLLYSLDREDYGETETNHIPLLYSLMAVGCLFEKHNGHNPAEPSGGPLAEGLKYFEICRDMVDLEACDNLFDMQAIFFMNLFLISTCRLSRCYTYVSHMLSLAFRMGLHRPGKTDSPVVVETKRSLFWAIWQLLVTLASMCGLPKPVPVEEIGMDYPETIAVSGQPDQERTGPKERVQVPETIPSHLSYLKLHEILYRVVKSLYPPSTMQHRDGNELLKHYVTKDTIFKLEDELQRWAKHLAIRDILAKHENNQWPRSYRAEHELCMAFAHTQVYLYRPFMHYLFESHNVQQEGRKYARAGIRASCNIIRLAQDMHRHDLLFGSQWRVAHMISTSALTLLYVLLIDKNSTMAQYLKTELNIARAMLLTLRPYCIHSQRTHIALTVCYVLGRILL